MTLRTILTSTAVVALMSGTAFAQAVSPAPMDAPAAPMSPAAPAAPMSPAAPASQAPLGADTNILFTADATNNMASKIIGAGVYSSTADNADHFGDVNDLILDAEGNVAGVVVGVGGFLGIGEKQVALNYDSLEWVVAADNTQRFILPTTREALEAAPEFEAMDETPVAAARPADTTAPMGAAPAAPMADANTYDRTTMTPIELGSISADDLLGTSVIGPENDRLGEIGDIILTPEGQVDAVVVDFGGFLGIGEKKVAVGYDNLQFTQDANGARYLWVNSTREQLEAAPAYDAATYTDNRDTQRMTVAM